jgi:hypothetical protein
MARIARPLNKEAVRKANDDFYKNHPDFIDKDGKRIPLSANDPKQANLRNEWKESYLSHGGKEESNKKPAKKKPADPVMPCKKKKGFKSGLGKDIDAAVAKCPQFQKIIEDLQKKGWKIEYGDAGKGTYASKKDKKIVVDTNKKGDIAKVVGSLAHEVGHARYKEDPYVQPAGLTKKEYVNANVKRNLKDEGEATLTNVELKNCLKKNGGVNINVSGAHAAKYEQIAKKYPDPKDRDKAREEIGNHFANNERPSTDPTKTYREYYEKPFSDFYDKLSWRKKTYKIGPFRF